jgi:hypothetical protein
MGCKVVFSFGNYEVINTGWGAYRIRHNNGEWSSEYYPSKNEAVERVGYLVATEALTSPPKESP